MNQDTQKAPKLRFKKQNSCNDLWVTFLLKNVSKIFDGTHQTPKYVNEGIPFYSVENVTSNDFLNTKFISEDAFNKEKSRVKIEKGDILMTRIGDVGTAKYIDWDVNASFYVSLALIKASPEINSKFLAQYINSNYFQHQLWKKTIHVAFPKKINLGDIGECKVYIPQLKEQKEISQFLETVDSYIENLKSQKEELEKYKKGMMQKIFSQQIRFKDENGNNFPEWKDYKLKDLIEVLTDYTANGSFASLRENVKYYNTEEYAVLVRSTDLNKEDFVPERFTDQKGYEFLKKTSLEEGDLIMANVGNIGDVFKVPAYQKPMTLAPNTYLIKFRTSVIKEFIFQIMLTSIFKNKVESLTVSSGFRAINKSTFGSIIIKIPDVKEQSKIAENLFLIDRIIKEQNDKIKLFIKWKKGLMQKMFI